MKKNLKELRKELTVNNLTFSFDNGNGTMDLQFEVEGKNVFVKNIREFDPEDEFYWDNEENLRIAVENAKDDDIEIEEEEEDLFYLN